jgi:hypothetical protein
MIQSQNLDRGAVFAKGASQAFGEWKRVADTDDIRFFAEGTTESRFSSYCSYEGVPGQLTGGFQDLLAGAGDEDLHCDLLDWL